MPVAMSLTRGSEHSSPCSSASSAPQAPPAAPQPGRAGEVGAAEAGHGAEHQHAFEPEVDAPALLGEAFAQADEEEGGAHAHGPADDGEQQVDPGLAAHARVLPAAATSLMRGCGNCSRNRRPRSASAARMKTKAKPAAPAPRHRAGPGGAAAGCPPRQSHRTAAPPAGWPRGCGAPRSSPGCRCSPAPRSPRRWPPCARPPPPPRRPARRRRRPARRPAPPARRWAGHQSRGARVAAHHPQREACAVKLSHTPAATHSTRPKARPQCTSPSTVSGAMAPMRRPSPSGRVEGLFRLAGSRIGSSTKCLNSAMAM